MLFQTPLPNQKDTKAIDAMTKKTREPAFETIITFVTTNPFAHHHLVKWVPALDKTRLVMISVPPNVV